MITISAFKWVPDFARGQVRDLRARWALEEAGLPYKTRLLEQGDQDKPDYRALQPFGQVPILQDGDFTLFESGAIVLYNIAGKEVGRWTFEHAWPSKWSASDLDVGSDDPVKEEVTLVVEMLRRDK